MSALVPAFVRSLKKINNKKIVSSAYLWTTFNSQKTIRFYRHSPKVFEPVNNNNNASTNNKGNNRKGGFNPSISAREILIGIIVVSIAVSSYYSFKQTDRKLEYKEKVREERKESINEMKGNVKNWLQERKEKKEKKRREKMGIVEETDEEEKKEE
ncbi:hypothetical protein ABK040_002558 [Willaertia magna]